MNQTCSVFAPIATLVATKALRARLGSPFAWLLWLAGLVSLSCNQPLAVDAAGASPVLQRASLSAGLAMPRLALPTVSTQYDSLFRHLHRHVGFNGTVLMAHEGKITHMGAYGYGHLRARDTLELASNFQLASVSKVFTATAIMMLYEAGALDFDDPLQQYLPEFPYPSITIRHLLNHRTGLCRYMALAAESWDPEVPLSNADVLCLFAEQKPELWFEPGSRFNYINTNYAFLGLLVEVISGQRFDEFVQRHIFNPLGMEHSRVYTQLDTTVVPKQTHGYKRRWGRYVDVGHDYLDGVMGDKGVYSNILDLYRFDQALYQGRPVSLATQQEAMCGGSPELRTHNYGFGYRMKTNAPGVFYHFGWWRGFLTCFIRDVERKHTFIVLSNRDNIRRSMGFWQLFQENFPLEPAISPQEVHFPDSPSQNTAP